MRTALAAAVSLAVLAGVAVAAPLDPDHDHVWKIEYDRKTVKIPVSANPDSPTGFKVTVECPPPNFIMVNVDVGGSTALVRWETDAFVNSAEITFYSRLRLEVEVWVSYACYTGLGYVTKKFLPHKHAPPKPIEQKRTESYDPSSRRTVTVSCPAGSVPIGGTVETADLARVQSSYPNGQAWAIEMWNQSSDTPASATITTRCLPTKLGPAKRTTQGARAPVKPHSLQVKTVKLDPAPVPKGSTTTLRAVCPANTKPIGGGWQTTAGTVARLGTKLDASGYSVDLIPLQNADAQGAVYAVCLVTRTTKGTGGFGLRTPR